MAEKKGLFSRLFGRKDQGETETEAEIPADPALADAAPLTDEDAQDAPSPELLEEFAAEDAAESTVETDEEPVAVFAEPPVDVPADEYIEHDTDEPLTVEDEPAPVAAVLPDPEPVVETPPTPDPEPAPEPVKKRGLFGRLSDGLAKTSQKLSSGIGGIFTKRKLDDETLEELEDLLITADLGLPATTRIITTLSKEKYDQQVSDEDVRHVLATEIARTLEPLEKPLSIDPNHRPHIILMTGVNGAGKTTTIGKLAKKFSDDGLSVLLAAGDTFRAAAIEQLKVWGERTGAPVVARDQGADAAGLAYDAIQKAQADNIDVVLIDTAGRLQNRSELMDELAKIVRVIKKLAPDAPHDTLLVLDATVGQNALSQAETFTQIAGVSGLVMTKLDGTARGGVLVALGDRFGLPIHYIGVGEAVEDLQAFKAGDFARALTAPDKEVQ